MDPLDPAVQSSIATGWQPLLTLAIFACGGAFFLGALFTAIRRGIDEEGWFRPKENDDK